EFIYLCICCLVKVVLRTITIQRIDSDLPNFRIAAVVEAGRLNAYGLTSGFIERTQIDLDAQCICILGTIDAIVVRNVWIYFAFACLLNHLQMV
ncbi:hypothetical protein SAMN05216388_11161, partial [Halorientalis persicus]